jgi:stage II sporulation protein D
LHGTSLVISIGELVIISRFDGKIAVKPASSRGIICDSVFVKSLTDDGSFSLRLTIGEPVRQFYSGHLNCYSDMGALMMINNCSTDQYIAGVIRAEGGSGQKPEYYKTQAVIARTYLYKYFDKHISDGYNLCDNTHCQAFNGISADPTIVAAAKGTSNLVILDRDSLLIISAFHSNCGGETSTSEDVWLTNQPYLKKVIDPYCINSRNAKWQKNYSPESWISYLKKSGLTGNNDDLSTYNFVQNTRLADYSTGQFTIPLRIMRSDLNLRSSFFSVVSLGDSIVLNGKGYGHGVGLCQEGAMVMAGQGFSFKQIIDFYYSEVIITDIKYAKAIQ